MISVISPAKTMATASLISLPTATTPRFMKESRQIMMQMAQFTSEELAGMLKINPQIAAENYLRFQRFFDPDNSALPALFAYTGVVYKYINPADFTVDELLFAQHHLRIASFGYGLLRPLDLIKPYRMEHDVKLPELTSGNMYAYWRDKQTSTLIKDVKEAGGELIYLASMDIQPAFDWKKVTNNVRVITPEFKIWKNGKPKSIVIYAKMARGAMNRFLIKGQLTHLDDLKAFSWEGFSYDDHLSKGGNWVFIQQG